MTGAVKRIARTFLPAANRCLAHPAVTRRLLRDSVVVFLYHEVSESPAEFATLFGLNVRPEAFSRQLEMIGSHFHWVSPEELLAGRVRKPAALITFDDGNLSYFRNALPILKGKGIPSTALLNMGAVRGEVCWSGLATYLQKKEPGFSRFLGRKFGENDYREFTRREVNRYLDSVDAEELLGKVREFRGPVATERELESVSREPLVWLGNHLYNHYNATLLNGELREEYRKNQRLLEGHPRQIPFFSYPFSCLNRETTRILREEGTKVLFGGGGLPNWGDHGNLYAQIVLDDPIDTEEKLFSRILQNVLAGSCRRLLRGRWLG